MISKLPTFSLEFYLIYLKSAVCISCVPGQDAPDLIIGAARKQNCKLASGLELPRSRSKISEPARSERPNLLYM
ncbi:MAG: hypothetical protein ACI8W8_003163 [Rhodothermales bacterium]|jgi:hypothetical protein